MMFSSFQKQEVAGQKSTLHCNSCQSRTIHSLEAKVEAQWNDGEGEFGGIDSAILRCLGCNTVTFEEGSWDNYDFVSGYSNDVTFPRSYVYYPPRSFQTFKFDDDHVPRELKAVLDELVFVFAESRYLLSTVALRMAIEFVAKAHKTSGNKLHQYIVSLRVDGHITPEQETILLRIKDTGNDSAHEAKPLKGEQLLAGMGILQELLDKFYNLPAKSALRFQSAKDAFPDLTPPWERP